MNRYDIIQKRKQDVGKRIRLIDIADAENDPQMRRLIGQTGTIVKVDDSGSYQVDWDNSGSRLSVLIEDTVEFLDEISEGGKRRMKSKRNTVNESGFSNDDIEFVARNVAGHLAGGFRNSSLPKETYNDFIELINNDETRDLFIEDMNIFYHQYFEGKAETDGGRSKMNESKTDNFRRNFQSFKNSLNESFNNQELTNALAEHGGIKNTKYSKLRDARSYNTKFDIRYAEYSDYLEPQELEVLSKVNPYWPIVDQLLYTNDGGAIVITSGENEPDGYMEKLKKRGEKYMDKTEPSGEWRLLGVTDRVTRQRRKEHLKGDWWE